MSGTDTSAPPSSTKKPRSGGLEGVASSGCRTAAGRAPCRRWRRRARDAARSPRCGAATRSCPTVARSAGRSRARSRRRSSSGSAASDRRSSGSWRTIRRPRSRSRSARTGTRARTRRPLPLLVRRRTVVRAVGGVRRERTQRHCSRDDEAYTERSRPARASHRRVPFSSRRGRTRASSPTPTANSKPGTKSAARTGASPSDT